MACTLVEMTQESCVASDGGIRYSFIIDTASIDAAGITSALNVVSAMTTTGTWTLFEYDTDDDTAYYNQEGERTNNRHVFNQTAFMKFAGIDSSKGDAAQKIVECCSLAAVHFMNNGKVLLQGIELLASPAWQVSKKKCKATVNIMTDTGANEDRIEVTLSSQSRQASPFVTMTRADFE